jgi:uncharacterized protein (DUF433 family)
MIDWSTCEALERDPERVSGAWVFRGTRVPASALFENLEDGTDISQFVQWFPGVTIDQVRQVLEHVMQTTLSKVGRAYKDGNSADFGLAAWLFLSVVFG